MSAQDYSDLSSDAKDLVEKQLEKLRDELKNRILTPNETKMLLETAKWLSDMAFVEKEELSQMSDEELKRLKEREKKRAQRLKKQNEHQASNEGDPEAPGKAQPSTGAAN